MDLVENDKINIFVQAADYLIFDVQVQGLLYCSFLDPLLFRGSYQYLKSQSLVICEKLHLKIALIGPCPRQLTSDKTSFPGLVNKFQLKILLDYHSSRLQFFDSQTPLSDSDYDQHQKKKVLNLIDQKVSVIHAHKAEQYSNRKFDIVKSVAPRWSINFMADFSLRKRVPPPKGTDLFTTKVDHELYLVYLHFWKNGFWFTSALKYGVDWLAYEGSPEIFHSKV